MKGQLMPGSSRDSRERMPDDGPCGQFPGTLYEHYWAVILEFDQLWESGASRHQPEKMQQLLGSIEAFDMALGGSSLKGVEYAPRSAQ